MRLTPLVLHAGVRMPALTDYFSDALDVTSIDVVDGGLCTLNCASAHGVPLTTKIAVSITDAETPNAVTAAAVQANGNVLVSFAEPHDYTTGWGGFGTEDQVASAKLAGFTNDDLNGTLQISEVPDRDSIEVIPTNPVASIVLTGNEVALERLEAQIIGWHAVTAATANTLTFQTPIGVSRSYTVANPVVVRNIRVFGALDLEAALKHFTRSDNEVVVDQGTLFVTPIEVKTSRSKHSRGDAVAEITDAVDHRQLMLDGFEVFAAFPTENDKGAIQAIDRAQGDIFNAVLRTFYGLKPDRPELAASGDYVATLDSHGPAALMGSNYWHRYRFQAQAYLTNGDTILPVDFSAIDVAAVTAPSPAPPDTIHRTGAPAFRDLDLTGILHDGFPQPLTGSVTLD